MGAPSRLAGVQATTSQDSRDPPAQAGPITHCLVGGVAGSANILTGYPFDTVKVRLQQPGHTYRGAWDCLSRVWREEGMRALYRGAVAPLVGGAAETAINYLAFNAVSRQLAGAPPDQAPLWGVALSSAAAGLLLSPVLSPAELLKCRVQASSAGPASAGAALREGIRAEGARFLFRGTLGTVAREAPGNCVYFTAYEGMMRSVGARRGEGGREREGKGVWGLAWDLSATVVCGGVAGMLMWAVVLPVDVCKTRVQTAAIGGEMDRGLLWHARHIVATEGWRGLYAGIAPVMVRAFPSNAMQWLAWEAMLRGLGMTT